MSKAAVEVRASSIRIVELEVPLKEVASYFRSIPAEERVFTLTKAIEVGVFCLERGRTAQDTDFVKRKITELLTEVEHAVTDIPTKAEEALVKKMGTAEGQVLSPVKRLIDDAARESTRRIGELKALLADDLDPKNAKSTLGSALQSLRELLNPKNTESVQSVLCQAVASATTESGTLAKAVKAQVEDALKPLLSEIDSLAKEVRGTRCSRRGSGADDAQGGTLRGGSCRYPAVLGAGGRSRGQPRRRGQPARRRCRHAAGKWDRGSADLHRDRSP